MSRPLSLVLALAFAAACATSDAATAEQPSSHAKTPADARAVCVQTMTRNRACTDAWIPALVDARARHDVPAGIAADVKADRDAVIARAKAEWANDSTDASIGATCDRLVASAPPQADLDAATACLATSACGEYVGCVTPLFEKHFTK